MNSFFEFMRAALPWIALGLLLAVLFGRGIKRKKDKDKRENYTSEGMSLGMCFGVAIGSGAHIDIGLGLMAGMLLGYVIGSYIQKT